MIEAVIFDMDGVLIDSENHWQRHERELFGEMGIELTDELLVQTRGLTSEEMVNHWSSRFDIDGISHEDLMKDYDRRMILTMEKEVPLMDGALEAIQFFMEKNIPVALASCTNYNLIEAAMNRHDLRKYFKLMVSASGVMPGKPHPEVYIQTAAKMGADPTRCLAIEDSFFGVISAKAAKMKVVAMPDPSEYNQDRFSAADAKIRSLREIDDELFKKLENL